jgi:exonuclease SbcC
MRFTEIHLKNYRCFDSVELKFSNGVTVVHGENGSGKTSLLEACFFALYGADAIKASNENLEDVVSKGAESAEVTLWFSHQGQIYKVHRELRQTANGTQQRTCTLESPEEVIDGVTSVDEYIESLFRMDSDAFLNSAYVRQGEINRLIEATPEERQDIIDKLLQLGVLEVYRERADKVRLGVKRAREAQETVLEDAKEQLENIDVDSLNQKKGGLSDRISDIETEMEQLAAKRDALVEKKDSIQRKIDEHKDAATELNSVNEDINELNKRLSECQANIDSVEESIEEVTAELSSLHERIQQMVSGWDEEVAEINREVAEGEDSDISIGDIPQLAEQDPEEALSVTTKVCDRLQTRVESLRQERQTVKREYEKKKQTLEQKHTSKESSQRSIENKRERVNELEEKIEERRTKIDDLTQERSNIQEKISSQKEKFSDFPVEFGEARDYRSEIRDGIEDLKDELRSVEADLERLRKEINQAQNLLDEGKCPKCGQETEDSPHVSDLEGNKKERDALEERVQELKSQIGQKEEELSSAEVLVSIEQNVDELESDLDRIEQQMESTNTQISDTEEQLETLSEEIGSIEDEVEEVEGEISTLESELEDLESNQEEVSDRQSQVENYASAVSDTNDKLETCISKMREKEDLENKMETLKERKSQLAERLGDKHTRQNQLEQTLSGVDVQELEADLNSVTAKIEGTESSHSECEETRSELVEKRGRIESRLEQASELKERVDSLEEKVEASDNFYRQVKRIKQMYSNLRSDLRQQNVAHLEQLLNELFSSVYQHDSYSHIELDGNYGVTIHEKGGGELDPEKLSGGESAIFNLALRCAIYQLLVEGLDEAPPMPPLIFDEPTAHLDSGHVDNLPPLVEKMNQIGVDQVLVISHTEEIIDGADERVKISQRAASNRSEVSKGDGQEEQTLSL